jgi:hypothetical protein
VYSAANKVPVTTVAKLSVSLRETTQEEIAQDIELYGTDVLRPIELFEKQFGSYDPVTSKYPLYILDDDPFVYIGEQRISSITAHTYTDTLPHSYDLVSSIDFLCSSDHLKEGSFSPGMLCSTLYKEKLQQTVFHDTSSEVLASNISKESLEHVYALESVHNSDEN